ncbi:hypothetical protein ACJMK2_042373 [Sinanodonta woodiana]|uniref:Uncharacterized protein n=1 Tax=Sinanodonta woodiana TaxID=1069815 RepID=A0ABD3W747_SINWO
MGCCREDKKVNDIELKEINQAAVEFEGPVAERSCRDVIFLLIFIAYLGGMGYVSYLGIHQGNPYRIVYGVDSWGNVCSQKNDKIAGVALSGIDMTHRT